jgi:hypothetical protein
MLVDGLEIEIQVLEREWKWYSRKERERLRDVRFGEGDVNGGRVEDRAGGDEDLEVLATSGLQ